MTHGLNTPRVTKSEASSAERINNSEGLRKNTLRSFILTNIYIPLVCRWHSQEFHPLFQHTTLAFQIYQHFFHHNSPCLVHLHPEFGTE